MDGILNIYKEKGYTSHDVVAKLRGILRQKKIGHTGTLDPQAEGVLPVCVGKATKLCDLLTEKEKGYIAVLRLGVETDTQDMTGTILKEHPVHVTQEQVKEVIQSFLGNQMQIPPMYSALKIQGKKLYELAREGKVVERPPRPVVFYNIEILEMKLPCVKIKVLCSKGTYIRTLCHDIGERLGCKGCMESLLRIQSGDFLLEDSLRLSRIEEQMQEGTLEDSLISIEEVFKNLPFLKTRGEGDRLLHNGNPLNTSEAEGAQQKGWARAYDSRGSFVGIYQWKPDKRRFYPVKMFYS